MGVPGPSPVPFFGTILEYRRVRCTNLKGHNITRSFLYTSVSFCMSSSRIIVNIQFQRPGKVVEIIQVFWKIPAVDFRKSFSTELDNSGMM